METLRELEDVVTGCIRCPRLIAYCRKIAVEKKKEFREWDYWGKPVAGFGDPRAKLWIVGLAPAAHGANRTGRMFTGDSSGNWLYRVLHETGFANQTHSTHREDGLKLWGVYICAACRCAPPDNKPLPEELKRCATYLETEATLLKERRLILALGAIAFKAVHGLLKARGEVLGPVPTRFEHGKIYRSESETVLCSYHPSRQNTQTGRLTWQMWKAVFDQAREEIKKSSHE